MGLPAPASAAPYPAVGFRLATGVQGCLRVGYQLAAELGRWELHLGTEATLSAEVLSKNPYWMEQRPIGLELVVGPGRWKWSEVTVKSFSGTRIEIQLPGKPDTKEKA